MTEIDNVQTIVDTAIATAKPTELQPGRVYGWALPNGSVHRIDLTGDEYRDQPKRKTGTVTVEDVDSFLEYFRKHADDDSEIYVNIKARTITAVLDAHHMGAARRGEHRLVLKLATSTRWDDWTRMDRQPMPQLAWAEFIEDHINDIREPSAAEMLEIAQTFQTNTKVKFGSTTVLANGDRRLQWEETTDATAGAGGKLKVPASFLIGIAPFDFANPFKVTARFRYRVSSGNLTVAYLLDDLDGVMRSAVLEVVVMVEQALTPNGEDAKPSHKVMRGVPA